MTQNWAKTTTIKNEDDLKFQKYIKKYIINSYVYLDKYHNI